MQRVARRQLTEAPSAPLPFVVTSPEFQGCSANPNHGLVRRLVARSCWPSLTMRLSARFEFTQQLGVTFASIMPKS